MGRSESRITRVENLCRRHREQVGDTEHEHRVERGVEIGLMIDSVFFLNFLVLAVLEVGSVFDDLKKNGFGTSHAAQEEPLELSQFFT